jgi:hypothetical protein
MSADTIPSKPALPPLNSPGNIQERGDGKLTWVVPLLFLPTRSVLLIFGQVLFALCYRLRGHLSPWSAAGAWWTA